MEWLTAIRKSIEYMEGHLCDNISAQDVAEQVHISPLHFQRGFLIMTGYSVSEYIRNRKLFKVCGRKVWISGQDNSQFAKFWEKAHASGMVQELKGATNPAENVTKSNILGVSCVEKNPSNRAFDFYIASECSGLEGYEEYEIPAGSWAIFTNKGELPMSLVNAEMYAFTEWLPQSGYAHAFAPELEVYLADDKDTVEFWLPIVEKAILGI